MPANIRTNEALDTQDKEKKRHGSGTVILLIVFLVLFILTTAILGSRMYELATRDQYTVDLGLGDPEGTIELFRIEYENELGEITVQGVNGENVVAPGTAVNYDIRLRNNDNVIIDFLMTPEVAFLTENSVPVEFKMVDSYGNYILGSETEWVSAGALNQLAHKGSIHPGEVFTYHVSWQWGFEIGDEQDTYDTYLGNQGGDVHPGVRVSIITEAVANPIPPKDNNHMMHFLGEGFGCCWCCYLVWFLILVCLVLVIWAWRLKRKLSKLTEIPQALEGK